jgi:hypothetical protein
MLRIRKFHGSFQLICGLWACALYLYYAMLHICTYKLCSCKLFLRTRTVDANSLLLFQLVNFEHPIPFIQFPSLRASVLLFALLTFYWKVLPMSPTINIPILSKPASPLNLLFNPPIPIPIASKPCF